MEISEAKIILGNSQPFAKLNPKQLDRLIEISKIKEYKNGQIVYQQGSPPDSFYFLLKGRVTISTKSTEDKEPQRIEIIKRGVCFGVISLLTGDNHSVTATSIENSFILEGEKESFNQYLNKIPSLSLDFSRILSQRVKVRTRPKKIFQSKKIGIVTRDSNQKNVYIVDLAKEIKKQTKKKVICIRFASCQDRRKDNISNFSGISSEKKILALGGFREEDVLDYILHKDIDYLYIKDILDNFISLLNFLSEGYHFILYEIPENLTDKDFSEFINSAYQLHLLVFPQAEELNKMKVFIKRLKFKHPLKEAKIVLAKSAQDKNLSFNQRYKLFNHPVYATLPLDDSVNYSRLLRRIARQVGEVTVGIALGSGAAYGFSHIGVLRILEENGVEIDMACGSSMGAVISALWAVGFSLDEIEDICLKIGKKISSFSILGFSFPFKGIIRAKSLENILKSIFGNLTFYDLKHTLKIISFDFLRRRTKIIEEGLIYKAVAASCAFPGIFEPVEVKKDIFLDGGILNPLPAKILLSYGASKIIASNISLSHEQALREYRKRDRFHVFDFVFGSVEVMQQKFIQEALEICDVVIHTNLEGLGWMEFDKISEFIKRGEAAASSKVNEIKEVLIN